MYRNFLVLLSGLAFFITCSPKPDVTLPVTGERWSVEKANAWYAEQPWLIGSNFIPGTAINPIEMWQAATYDSVRIDQELQWASALGFNTMRVFLNNLVWEADSQAYLERIDHYLAIANRHQIKTMFVLFDAVWNPISQLGPQPAPVPHKHNSGWVQCPNAVQLQDSQHNAKLENYVKSIVSRFANDSRVVIWDLFNEPDNDNFGKFPAHELPDKRKYTYELLVQSFKWAREVNPRQPLTAGVWWGDWSEARLGENKFNVFQLENSDLISFHGYDNEIDFKARLQLLKRFKRPIICTEYMARPQGNTFEKVLPILKAEKIGAINWGFVSGKSQTIYPWDSWEKVYTAEPDLWFHDILRNNGQPYEVRETEFIRQLTGKF